MDDKAIQRSTILAQQLWELTLRVIANMQQRQSLPPGEDDYAKLSGQLRALAAKVDGVQAGLHYAQRLAPPVHAGGPALMTDTTPAPPEIPGSTLDELTWRCRDRQQQALALIAILERLEAQRSRMGRGSADYRALTDAILQRTGQLNDVARQLRELHREHMGLWQNLDKLAHSSPRPLPASPSRFPY